jgi:YfiH family protein
VNTGSLLAHIGDAQWTDIPNILLSLAVADCIPVLFWTEGDNPIIGTIHAGRKGITKNIIKKTFLKLKKKGYLPEHIYAHIGPCICQECFIFGKDGKNPYTEGFSEIYMPYICEQPNATRTIDLRGILHAQLVDAHISTDHITQDTRCTMETPELCSWRRDGIKGKNNYAWITL